MAKRKYHIVIAKEAQDDLRKELNYLRRKRSDQTARYVNKGIQDIIKTLDTFPERHGKLHRISDSNRTYRFVPKWAYMIIYRVEKAVVRI
ncbi:MAG: type II toxin-antitoxin system RelE/ParE family toxin, partial [Bacteroidota bacterium]